LPKFRHGGFFRDFGDPQQRKQKLLKADTESRKSPAHAMVNDENGAFLLLYSTTKDI
jgi:hypothetical protein